MLHYQQILSMALEDRSSSYEDLVSNNNALLAVLKRKGLWQTYSGPRIRQTLQIGKQVAQWYSRLRPAAQSGDRSVQRRLLRPEDGRRARSSSRCRRSSTTRAKPADGRLRQLHGRCRARAGRHHGRGAVRRRHRQRRQAAHRPRDRGADRHQHRRLRRHRSRRPPRSGAPRPTTPTTMRHSRIGTQVNCDHHPPDAQLRS